MDAAMTQQGLNEMGIDDVDLIFIENVGNLVCPAEFDTGAGINITILSVPEEGMINLQNILLFILYLMLF